mgnify:CR=1 FL=1
MTRLQGKKKYNSIALEPFLSPGDKFNARSK